ncbi:MAG: circularly permuted type 2 ATP-grasp protein [Methylophilales bacterium]|nr:circularly permuted type 2 ATP-grasp protein [Methylophilales bacterium]
MKPQSITETQFQSYPSNVNSYDEMLDGNGQVRPHWAYLMHALNELGTEEVTLRHKESLKLLRENGVTYNVYGDPNGTNRPWKLDPVPLPISGDEWVGIEAGLLQRAELLNLILTDLYGPRELIRKGLLPMELVYNHGGFLRACDQIRLNGRHQLVLYAADLARGPDQKMWVLGDRTQAPSGSGYALENRLAMSRVLPTLLRNAQVHRLEPFFQSLRAGLNAIAPDQTDVPRVAVLTPGPFNETFFEHAYLASHLGYPLVQGDDLTVRDGHVWLKSLTGLQRVDVILRRVDDNYCDPLELREDSRLGVPGLLEVARRGNVAIANPLGSSILENPGIQPFLPGIAQHFLGQSLKLPSIATWWCGQPRELEYVISNIHQLVIKPIYRKPGVRSVFGHLLSKQELSEWRARIRANPAFFVGQEHESFSTVPSLVGNGYEPRQTLLRCFLVARAEGYTVMPGGLTRSAPEKGDIPISNQMGGISKDTWVIASEPQHVPTSNKPEHVGDSNPNHNNALPSRAADNIFWVGRYAERAEGSIRLLRATIKKLYINPDRDNPIYEDSLHSLLRGVTNLTGTWPGFFSEDPEVMLQSPDKELLSVVLNEQRSGSIANSLRCLVQSGFAVRDLWSSDTWRVMDEMEDHLNRSQPHDEGTLWHMQDHLDHLITTLCAFSGLVMENMTRGNGWLFLDIGRRLERSLLLISTLRTAFSVRQNDAVETQLIESLLDTSDNTICYRQHYRNYFELPSFLELLLLDTNNPRSLAYQIASLQEHVAKLPHTRHGLRLSGEERLMLEASSILSLANLDDFLVVSKDNIRENLDQQLSRLYYLLSTLSETITADYFRHGSSPQPL